MNTEKKFILKNSEGSVVEVYPALKEVRLFRDPWGRDSSGTPDDVFAFDKLPAAKDFWVFVKTNMHENDLVEFEAMVKTG